MVVGYMYMCRFPPIVAVRVSPEIFSFQIHVNFRTSVYTSVIHVHTCTVGLNI